MEESGVWMEWCDRNETEIVVELPRGTQPMRGGCFFYKLWRVVLVVKVKVSRPQ